MANLLVGISYGWWRSKHTRHHANPNRPAHDPDIDSDVLVFAPTAATRKTDGAVGWLVSHQGWYFLPLTVLEGLSLHWDGIRRVVSRGRVERRWVELSLLAVRLGSLPTLLFMLLPPSKAFACLAVQLGLFGPYLGSSFAPNRIGMPLVSPTLKLDFLRRQVLVSRNISGGRAASIALGGLNYQIEHHLFPSMPRPHLRKVAPPGRGPLPSRRRPLHPEQPVSRVPARRGPPQHGRSRPERPAPVPPGGATAGLLDGRASGRDRPTGGGGSSPRRGCAHPAVALPVLAVVVAVALGLIMPRVDAAVDEGCRLGDRRRLRR